MTCTYVLDHGRPCGRQAVAAWENRLTGLVWLCATHDQSAVRACAIDSDLTLLWYRTTLDAPQTAQDGPGRPEAAGVA